MSDGAKAVASTPGFAEWTFPAEPDTVRAARKLVRATLAEAQERLALHGNRTVLFLDEIHRFNKAQQDALPPHVEDGTVTLVGATTENPYFEVNAALLWLHD